MYVSYGQHPALDCRPLWFQVRRGSWTARSKTLIRISHCRGSGGSHPRLGVGGEHGGSHSVPRGNKEYITPS